MKLDALHHITMITADARKNVEFYADILGLRLVKKTVNFDAPDAYHLYFGDEQGSPGSILTWFEFRDAARGSAGAGMIHRLELGVASPDSLDFWEQRLRSKDYPVTQEEHSLGFEDYDGLAFALVVSDDANQPLRAEHPEIPREHAIVGIEGARAYTPQSIATEESPLLTQILGFTYDGERSYSLAGERRRFRWTYDPAPEVAGIQGAGSVHHIAWACAEEEQLDWQKRLHDAGRHVTEVLDREYFTSIYFREERRVLFEIATHSPGFAVDEDPEHLGEALRLPPQYERLRPRLEEVLAPIENPRAISQKHTRA
jgi:glyoxalase family protein